MSGSRLRPPSRSRKLRCASCHADQDAERGSHRLVRSDRSHQIRGRDRLAEVLRQQRRIAARCVERLRRFGILAEGEDLKTNLLRYPAALGFAQEFAGTCPCRLDQSPSRPRVSENRGDLLV
jgi:hypothetical protein